MVVVVVVVWWWCLCVHVVFTDYTYSYYLRNGEMLSSFLFKEWKEKTLAYK